MIRRRVSAVPVAIRMGARFFKRLSKGESYSSMSQQARR